MARTTVTITLKPEVHDAAKEVFPNLSGAINEMLEIALVEKKPEAKQTIDWIKKNQILEQNYNTQRKTLQDKLDKLKQQAIRVRESTGIPA